MAAGNDRILPHFHIPLQSGCNKILGLMRRRYTRELFSDRVTIIRKAMPYAGIGADVIVGFPGESHADFEETYSFIKGLPLSYLHVFTFSERPDTVAEKMPGKVSPKEKAERSRALIDLSDSKSADFNNLNEGQVTMVLFENSRSEGMITGFSSNYIRVEHPWNSMLAGQVKKVKLNSVSSSGRMTVEIID
jgi:threonylcarbamoyladenosine tRNA methylthiotransferase MtaB